MFNFFEKNKNFSMNYIEPHEVVLDKLAQKKEKELGISEKKFEIPIYRSLYIFFYSSIIILLLLILRSFQLQILENKKYTELAARNKYFFHKIQAQRGVIYDRDFNLLVYNQELFALICEKEKLPQDAFQKEKILKEVSKILEINFQELKEKIEKETSPIVISENLSQQKLIILETKIDELVGFSILQTPIRFYPEGEQFSHIIGYLGKITKEEFEKEPHMYSLFDYVGKSGIEAFYEKTLRKNPGEIREERDALGRTISQKTVKLPQSGNSLVLFLNSNLQKKIIEILEKRLKELGTKKAAAVALDPQNGGILALVSLPGFDNNLFFSQNSEKITQFFKDQNQPLFNRAISGEYLMGSTIKPLVAIAALEEKIIEPKKQIFCEGKIAISNPWNPSLPTIKKDWKMHGLTDLKKAIAESCNIYFYTISGGLKDRGGLGVEKIIKYLKLFGWGEKTTIDFFGAREGLIPNPDWKIKTFNEPWRDGDTLNLAIGQGFVLATPLQIANAYAAIVNGGKLFQPQIVQKIIDSNDSQHIIKEFKPKILRENFVDPQNLQIVKEGMRQAVTGQNAPHATAVMLNSLPVSTGAKTGTAEVWQSGEIRYNNWITVFAPFENPEIVLTIVIEGVSAKDVESQLIVLPVAKEILEWYFVARLNEIK